VTGTRFNCLTFYIDIDISIAKKILDIDIKISDGNLFNVLFGVGGTVIDWNCKQDNVTTVIWDLRFYIEHP